MQYGAIPRPLAQHPGVVRVDDGINLLGPRLAAVTHGHLVGGMVDNTVWQDLKRLLLTNSGINGKKSLGWACRFLLAACRDLRPAWSLASR
jgi:hypothetical protein